jgi:putative membrane protein (TIGR04086 family)
MQARLAQVHWALVLKTAALLYVATLLLGLAVSFPLLAFLNWGHLDSPNALWVSSLIAAFLVVAVTGYGAFRVARGVGRAAPLHGSLVGLVVAFLSLLLDLLFRRALEPVGLVLYVLMVAAGVLGGVLGSILGSRKQAQSSRSPTIEDPV